MDEKGKVVKCMQVASCRKGIAKALGGYRRPMKAVVEASYSWGTMYDWLGEVAEEVLLAHPSKVGAIAEARIKTDKIDSETLAHLLRADLIPEAYAPSAQVRATKRVLRQRMFLVRVRTMLKNRIHATLAKYAIQIQDISDIFGTSGRLVLRNRLRELPPQTRRSVEGELTLLDQVEDQVQLCEKQIKEVVMTTPAMMLLMTLPGVGPILAVVIAMEIGEVGRFPGSQHLASYAGTVPRIYSSGGKTFHGKARPDVNRYLKWAFVEAANVVVLHQRHWPERHAVRLYQRIRQRKGHAKAVVAVARHLAEAAYWVLKKNEPYKEPKPPKPTSSTRKETRNTHES